GICSRGTGWRRGGDRPTASGTEVGSGAMSAASPRPVTPCLSGWSRDAVAAPARLRRPRRRRREGEPQRLALLVRQRAIRPPLGDRLGIDTRPRPGMEAADHEPRPGGVGEGEGEALVPAGVLERVEPDETDPLDRPTVGGFEAGRSG